MRMLNIVEAQLLMKKAYFKYIENKNKLTDANVETILNTFAERKELEIFRFQPTLKKQIIARK